MTVRRATQLAPKDSAEVDIINFIYTDSLQAGESLVSAVCEVDLEDGTDTAPAALLLGSPSVDAATVRQSIQGGVVGATYTVRCRATTSATRVLVVAATIPVVRL